MARAVDPPYVLLPVLVCRIEGFSLSYPLWLTFLYARAE